MSNKNVPAYLSLVLKTLTTAQKLGLTVQREMGTKSTLPENNNFCFVMVDGGDAALIIPKHTLAVKYCDLHIEWKGQKGYIAAVDTRGAVVCQIDPSQVDLELLLTSLSGTNRAAKKGAKKASQQAIDEMTALLKTLGVDGDSQPDSEEDVGTIVEETESDSIELQ